MGDRKIRGGFVFSVDDTTPVTWRGKTVSREKLNVGDTIFITFIGSVLETEPAQIQQVEAIQILDDEK